MVIGEYDHTVEDGECGVALHDFIKQEGGETGQACARPDTAQHEHDPSLVADDVGFYWVDDGYIPEREPKRLKFVCFMFNKLFSVKCGKKGIIEICLSGEVTRLTLSHVYIEFY